MTHSFPTSFQKMQLAISLTSQQLSVSAIPLVICLTQEVNATAIF